MSSKIDFKTDVRLNIVNVAEKCGIRIIGPLKTGNRVNAFCPFCDDKSGHLTLTIENENDNYYNVFKCLFCGEGGSAIDLYARTHNIDTKQAFKELLEDPIISKKVELINKQINENKIICKIPKPVEYLNTVYRKLLSYLDLSPLHEKNLLDRGMTTAEIKLNLYRSLPLDSKRKNLICNRLGEEFNLDCVPGFFRNNNGYWDMYCPKGFLIPVMDCKGQIQSLHIRMNDSYNKKRYKYFGSSGFPEGNPNGTKSDVHVHIAWGFRKNTKRIGITEGVLKATIASIYTGYTWLALPGVGVGHAELISIIKELKPETLNIAFDMDIINKPEVKKALDKLTGLLDAEKQSYTLDMWDKEYIKNSAIKGIDDYLYFLYKSLKA